MKIVRLFWETWLVAGRANIGLAAAGVAFYALFSIFPGLAALIALFGLVADPGIVDSQLALLKELIPEQIFLLLEDQLSRLLSAQSGTLG